MTYDEATSFLFNSLPLWEQKGAGAYKPGLERVETFAAGMGNPQERFLTVHVAGTNGKGSVSHMLAAVLQTAGYRTGLFTSPHLVDFRERIRVNGQMIPEDAVTEFTERHKDEMVRLGLTFFEMATVMAFDRFARSVCDVAIIETGLGGRLDSTNIISPVLSVITNIGLEHTQYLGDTIADIAGEKAGIIKPGVPVVIGESDPESAPVFRARAAQSGSPIIFADTDAGAGTESGSGSPEYTLDLGGDYQHKNLRTVLAAIDTLRRRFDISEEAMRKGLAHAASLTGLCGRWQIVGRDPLVVLDTAHNAHGLGRVAEQLARQQCDKLYMVLGFAGDKDLDAVIPLMPPGAHYILTQAEGSRAMPVENLQKRFATHGLAPIETVASVPQAVRRAISLALPGDMVYIGGSNFVVGEALAWLNVNK